MSPFSFGVLCFSSLFTVIDPLAVMPVFASMTSKQSSAGTRRLAGRAVLVAFGVLLAFALSGAALFRIFGITVEAFRIAGGIVFVLIGLPMLSGSSGPAPIETNDGEDPSVVPLGLPLIAGPGAITTTTLLMGQAETSWSRAAFFFALALVLAATFGLLLLSPWMMKKIGKTGLLLLTKIMGLIVIVIGVQFVIDGIRPVAIDILSSANLSPLVR